MTIAATASACPQCAAPLAPALLACPRCGALVYGGRLQQLADAATAATRAGEVAAALAAWREAIDLLPSDSRQHQVVAAKIAELSRAARNGDGSHLPSDQGHSSTGKKAAAGLGALGLLLWKFKLVLLFLLTKGKLLLLGLTKVSTLLTMLLSLGVYWAAWGWQFALGLVLSIYVHEMGHVAALKRLGFKATAPMFLPGLGAVIRLQQHPANPHEDAEIGLAGPLYGLGAAIIALIGWAVTHHPMLAAIASVGAWINLFNLLPVWTLDGGRAFHAMSRNQRWAAAAAVGSAWLFTHDGMLVLLLVVIVGRAVTDKGFEPGDRRATWLYVLLVLALSLICLVRPNMDRPI